LKKYYKIGFIICVLLLSCVLFSCGAKEESKVIFFDDFNDNNNNFSFEAYFNDEGYSQYGRELSLGVDGSPCLRISNVLGNDSRYFTEVKLKKNINYLISAKVKSENVEFGQNGGVSLSIYSLNASGFTFYGNLNDFTEIKQYFTVDKDDTYKICLRLGYFSGETTGSVYFDDVKLESISNIPENVKVASVSSKDVTNTVTNSKFNEETYKDLRIVSIFITFLFVIVFILWYKSLCKQENNKETSYKQFIKALILVFSLSLILRLILAATYYQCSIDVNLFKYWGNTAANDFVNFYNNATNCDYPPLYIYFLAAFSKLSFGNSDIYTILSKMTGILSDIAIGYIILIIGKRMGFKQNNLLFIVCFWLFNPIVLVDSSCWGQVDTVLSLMIVATILFIIDKKYLFAGLIFGLGVMLKPQMIILLPVCGAAFIYHFALEIKDKKIFNALIHLVKVAVGIVTGLVLPVLPFIGMGFKWIINLFIGTVDHYNYATVNAYNFWFILGKNWVSDKEIFCGLSYYNWGMIGIVLSSLVVLGLFIVSYVKNRDKSELDKSLVFIAGAFIYMFVFSFGPRMHERYFFPCVALIMLAYLYSQRKELLAIYLGTSSFGFIIIHEIMMGLECGNSIMNAGGSYDNYKDLYWPSSTPYRIIISIGLLICSVSVLVFICKHYLKRIKK